MKVKITVEYEVKPEKELNVKEHSNVVGMLVRQTRNRITGFVGHRLGGEHSATGWEVEVTRVNVEAVKKS